MSEPVKKLREYFSQLNIEHLTDEDKLADMERFLAEPIEISFVISRCPCGWSDSSSLPSDSPLTCPACSGFLVIRNQDDMNEIIVPAVTTN